MCHHLIENDFTTYIYNRTKEKAARLIENGATWCETPKRVAEESDYIFTIVGFPEDVREVVLGTDGIIEGMQEGAVLVDMTTSSPSLAEEIYRQAKTKGASALDAPVSGGDIGAKEGTLAIMVGGDEEIYDELLPIFHMLGENISYMGEPGAGQHTKMCNQILIADTMIGVVESLLYAYKAGMDPDDVIDIIGKGAASSWSINNLGRRIAKGDYQPGFYIKHFIKDMGIALQEAKRMNLALPGLSLVHQFYTAANAFGYEDLGTQGLYKILQHLNNISD